MPALQPALYPEHAVPFDGSFSHSDFPTAPPPEAPGKKTLKKELKQLVAQLHNLLARIERPEKNWKFDAADLDERALWDEYMRAYAEALAATSRPNAPWYAIPADNKPYMRVAVARIMVHTLSNLDMAYPQPTTEHLALLETGRARLLDGE